MVARMSASTVSGCWESCRQVNRSTVQPCVTKAFCRCRANSNVAWSVWNAKPSNSIASLSRSNLTSGRRRTSPNLVSTLGAPSADPDPFQQLV